MSFQPLALRNVGNTFPEAVGRLDIPTLIAADQPKVPHGIGDYRLVPIVGNNFLDNNPTPYDALLWHMPVDDADEIVMRYRDVLPSGKTSVGLPPVDGELGIALIRNTAVDDEVQKRMVAIITGNLLLDKGFQVVQIQATWTVEERQRKLQGLQGGFGWRKLLLRGLVDAAQDIGLKTVEVIGDKYRRGDEVREPVAPQVSSEQWIAGYDDIADALGFRPTKSGIWRKSFKRPLLSFLGTRRKES